MIGSYPQDVDKWSSLGPCLSVRGMLFESWVVLVQLDGSYSVLSPVVHGDIARIVLSTNTIQCPE